MITEKNFYNFFFKKLSKKNINYLVLKNFNFFPEKNISNDIDILLPEKENLNIVNILKQKKGIVTYKIYKKINGISIFLYGISRKNGSECLQIDLLNKLTWYGMTYISENLLLENKETINKKDVKINIINFKDYPIFIILSQILNYGFINKKYSKNIKNRVKNFTVKNQLVKYIGYKITKKLLLELEHEYIAKSTVFLIRLSFFLNKNFFLNLFNLSKYFIYNLIFKKFNKNYIRIVFLGPDGSGKSSIIKLLNEKIGNLFNETKIFHLKHKIWFFKNRIINRGIVKDPHKLKNRNLIISFVKIFFWAIGEVIYCFISRPKYPQMILLDRYFIDILFDPKRYRYNGSKYIVKFLSFLIPQPDLVVILYSDVKTLLKRKNEINKFDLKNLIKEYRSSNFSNVKSLKLNTKNNKKFIIKKIIKKVLKISKYDVL